MAVMNDTDKLNMLKTLLGISGTAQDTALGVYLTCAEKEILSWKYGNTKAAVPEADEIVQIHAAMAGFGHEGAPDETSHSENGINRQWKHADMISYIRANLPGFVKLGGESS